MVALSDSLDDLLSLFGIPFLVNGRLEVGNEILLALHQRLGDREEILVFFGVDVLLLFFTEEHCDFGLCQADDFGLLAEPAARLHIEFHFSGD